MGNTETTFISNLYSSWVNPKAFPSYDEPPKNDPLYGFTEERKPREIKVTEEDMYWAKVPFAKRDYCADHIMKLYRCQRENFPFYGRCHHFKHEYDHCVADDSIMRMKEFERERRLLQREQRKKAKQANEHLDAQ